MTRQDRISNAVFLTNYYAKKAGVAARIMEDLPDDIQNENIYIFTEKANAAVREAKKISATFSGSEKEAMQAERAIITAIEAADDALSTAIEAAESKLGPVELELLEEYKKVYPTDQGMQDYCRDKISAAVKLSTGDIYEFEKPDIETIFCFSEDINGMYDEETSEHAHRMTYAAKKENYFIEENLRRAFGFQDHKLEFDDVWVQRQHYISEPEELKMVYLIPRNWERDKEKGAWELKPEDREAIKAQLVKEKTKFTERLKKWYKRYGDNGIRTWTYYSD